jgi:hypothetical protein
MGVIIHEYWHSERMETKMKRFFWFMSLISFGGVMLLTFAPRSARTAPPPPNNFDLRAYGAVGDGVTNDGPALQSALNAIASAGGGTLIVPAGHYAIITPVSKDFTGLASSVVIRGVASSTTINTKGSGEQISHGLDLTSEFVIKVGHPNVALALSGLTTLLITDMVFIGTPDALSDARIPLVLGGIPDATIRHSEFYGLSSLYDGGAIVYADNCGLTIDQTAFLGSTGNSGVRNSVILTTNWKSISLTESVFVDYGQRPGYYGKLGLAPPYSWIMVGNAAPVDSASPRRDTTIRNVFMDEGGFMAIASIPDFYNQSAAPADLIYISDYKLNVSNLGASAVYIDRGAQHVMLERASFGYSHNAGPAVYVNNIGDAILDKVTCTESVNTITATATVGKLTVINSTCTNIQSQAQSTVVLTTTPEDDPVQYVRHQYLAVLGFEPDAAAHYNYSNQLLLCGTDQTCITQRKNELNTFLNTPAAPTFLRANGVALSWQDNSFNETGFKVERASSFTGPWTEIATPGPNRNYYKFGSGGSSYFYRVRAFNAIANSDYANVACSSCVYLDSAPDPIFSDDFNDNMLDSGKWTINNAGYPLVSEQSQQLQLNMPGNIAGYNGISSNATYDLTSRMVQTEVVQPISQAGWCENFIEAELDPNNYFLIDVGATSMVLRSRVAAANDQTVIGFNPTAHHYWRIRHDQNANTINFETSPDTEVWTTQKTAATGFPVTSLRFYLFAGCWGTGNANPGVVKYDNFQLAAGTTGSISRIPNYGFESPAVGYSAFQYSPTGGSWTFAGGSGVTGNGSGFTGGLNIAPEGSQAAFLQGGNTSIISQSVSGFQANRTYVVTFAAAQRSNCCNAGGQDFQVYIDNTLIGTFHPASGTYAYYGTPGFTTTAGSHTLKFVGLNPLGGDHTAFIDNVRVTPSTGW